MISSEYHQIYVESFYPDNTSGRHGKVHVRPIPGQALFPETLFVECSRTLIRKYPVGTVFKITGKISLMKGTPYIYSHHSWPYEVVH